MKGKLSGLFLFLVLIVGLSLLLYPTVSDYWNSLHQSRAIANYAEEVAVLDENRYDEILSNAVAYNTALVAKTNRFAMTDADIEEYMSQLSIAGDGIIGYIEIPIIDVSLPIYHGVDEKYLQVALGHIEWSSLPIGGESTHSVISGHRGLPSARLFTDISELVAGDTFVIRVLDETMTYEVDQILIVLPEEVDSLGIEAGKDLCTLVTCTPYGVNSHRLLVRGHRIENAEEAKTIRVTADASQIDPIVMAPLIAAPMLLLLLFWLMVGGNGKKKKKN